MWTGSRIPGVMAAVLLLSSGCASLQPGRSLVVCVPVADIRKEPVDKVSGYGHDDLQETQALYNEVLTRVSSEGQWYKIAAGEQLKFSAGHGWTGYPGYIRKRAVRAGGSGGFNAVVTSGYADVYDGLPPKGEKIFSLSLGTRLKTFGRRGDYYNVSLAGGGRGWIDGSCIGGLGPAVFSEYLRAGIVKTAVSFIGNPYLWGGRSFHMPLVTDVATGADCSGLVHLAYRVHGIDLPRDAKDQWRASERVNAEGLEPADLVFVSAPGEFDRVVHVMLYAGGEYLIESPETGKSVRRISFREKFGADLEGLKNAGFISGDRKILLGKAKALMY